MKSKTMKLFILTVVICFQLTNQLPVKESTTTDKASKEHHADEKAGYNLENVIGKLSSLNIFWENTCPVSKIVQSSSLQCFSFLSHFPQSTKGI